MNCFLFQEESSRQIHSTRNLSTTESISASSFFSFNSVSQPSASFPNSMSIDTAESRTALVHIAANFEEFERHKKLNLPSSAGDAAAKYNLLSEPILSESGDREGAASANGIYEYGIADIQTLSAMSKLAFRNTLDYNSAALSIQKKYRRWKARKDFIASRQKVMKIQGRVIEYQAGKQRDIIWAVGILEKAVLRWRRKGVGLRGFQGLSGSRRDAKPIDETGNEAAINEAVSQEGAEISQESIGSCTGSRRGGIPIATFFRFRSVCRKWNSLPNSESFSEHIAQVPHANPWFYTITHENVNSGAMYDPSLKKWHHASISSLPTKMIVLPVVSAGGLVCFIDIGHRNFYVCNPLTQSFKELPVRSVKVWSRIAVGMTLDGNASSCGGSYKILWVCCDGEYEVYDSMKNSWTRTGSMPSNIKLPLSLNFRSQAVSIDGTVYFMRSDPDGMVSYNLNTGVWKQFIIPAPLHLTDHTLAECGGRIMLVGLLTKNAAACVCIWELQKMTLLWKEVDRMPNIWCLEFYGKRVRMTSLGNKGLLMLSLRSRQMNRLVTYDVESREWLKVPGCLVPRGRKRQWIACGTAFHPSLAATA